MLKAQSKLIYNEPIKIGIFISNNKALSNFADKTVAIDDNIKKVMEEIMDEIPPIKIDKNNPTMAFLHFTFVSAVILSPTSYSISKTTIPQ